MATVFDGTFTGTYPAYTGWSQDPTGRANYNVWFTITQLAGQAPSGNDAVRFDEIAVGPGGGLQEFSAWYTINGLTQPAQGALWSLKYKFRLNGVQSWVIANDSTNAVIKAAVIGDGGVSGNRVITHHRAAPTSGQINIAAGMSTGTQTGFINSLSIDVWHSVQLLIQSGSSAGAADGTLRIYIDNDNLAAPNGTGTGIIIPVADWDQGTRFGPGTLRAILTGHNFSWDLADCMIDDVFDSQWHAGGDPPPPPSPVDIKSGRLFGGIFI